MRLPLPRRLLVPLFLLGCAANASAQERPVETTPEGFPEARTFVLRELDGAAPLRIHVFSPRDLRPGAPRPAFVFFFGGGWTRGTPERSAGWARQAARWRMIGIAPDYRTNQRHGTTPLEAVADGRLALRWVQDHAAELGIDPARIVVGGSSAGGHVALWTAIPDSPPGSSADEAPRNQPAALVLMSAVSDTSQLSGYTPRRFGDHAEALSPLHRLPASMPAVLAFHGDADTTVPHSQALALDAALRERGADAVLVTVPGGSHGFSSDLPEWKDRSRERIRAFLAERGLLQ